MAETDLPPRFHNLGISEKKVRDLKKEHEQFAKAKRTADANLANFWKRAETAGLNKAAFKRIDKLMSKDAAAARSEQLHLEFYAAVFGLEEYLQEAEMAEQAGAANERAAAAGKETGAKVTNIETAQRQAAKGGGKKKASSPQPVEDEDEDGVDPLDGVA